MTDHLEVDIIWRVDTKDRQIARQTTFVFQSDMFIKVTEAQQKANMINKKSLSVKICYLLTD